MSTKKGMHGQLGHSDWALPQLIAPSTEKARPDRRASMNAAEYMDEPTVLDQKISLLASLIGRSLNFVALTGAGVSTAAGITDYATKAKASASIQHNLKADAKSALAGNCLIGKGLALVAEPTASHQILTALEKKGLLKHWIYLNHDALPLKAGFPKEKLNEFHGSWFDPVKNPVVMAAGDLRPEAVRWLEEWAQKTDLCLAMGTSLCGLKADVVAASAAANNGLVIINLQQTPYDDRSALRIFATCDQAMALLKQKLKLEVS
jgi:NAD-dependent SIR2 family protein deacetylase